MIYKIKNDEYGSCIQLDAYNGKYSLVSAREGNDGKIYKKWGHYQTKDRTPSEKAIPWAVGRLDRQEFIDMLKHFLNLLEGRTDEHGTVNSSPQQIPEGNIPFSTNTRGPNTFLILTIMHSFSIVNLL